MCCLFASSFWYLLEKTEPVNELAPNWARVSWPSPEFFSQFCNLKYLWKLFQNTYLCYELFIWNFSTLHVESRALVIRLFFLFTSFMALHLSFIQKVRRSGCYYNCTNEWRFNLQILYFSHYIHLPSHLSISLNHNPDPKVQPSSWHWFKP